MTFRPEQKNIYSTSGTYAWVCPAGVNYINLTLIGGGGGAGGGGGGGGPDAGGGGGGGSSGACGQSGQLYVINGVKVMPGQSYTINVGNYGTGGADGAGGGPSTNGSSGGAGNPGSYSEFIFPNAFSYTALGGLGGSAGLGGTFGAGSVGGSSSGNGSQAGLGGTTGSSAALTILAVSPNTTTVNYSIYTTMSLNPVPGGNIASIDESGPINGGNTGIFGGPLYLGNISGNYSSLGFSNSPATSTTSSGTGLGGPGGVLSLSSYIPLYLIGTDLGLLPSSLSAPIFPSIFSYEETGLGGGGVGAASGSSPLARNAIFWSNSNATPFGFGAGGLGGPGGGGAGKSNGSYNGGNGYQGDRGLSGLVMISWQ